MKHPRIRVAMVGCGAIAEQQHIPALAFHPDCDLVALVDVDTARAKQLGARFEIPACFSDWDELSTDHVDAAVIALPNHLHAPATLALLNKGIHVLVEKPMALTSAQCDQMQTTARQNDLCLAVGHVRRFAHATGFAKQVIDSGLLGSIRSFRIEDGFTFRWPIASDYLIRKEKCGGGVLMDLGAHTLDQLLWWLGEVAEVTYFDDSEHGIEADCLLELTMTSGAHGTIELSRTRDLPGIAVITGDRAELEVGLIRNEIQIRLTDGSQALSGTVSPVSNPELATQRAVDLISAQCSDFFDAIRDARPPLVSGESARRAVALIETCYQRRQPLQFPWLSAPQSGTSA